MCVCEHKQGEGTTQTARASLHPPQAWPPSAEAPCNLHAAQPPSTSGLTAPALPATSAAPPHNYHPRALTPPPTHAHSLCLLRKEILDLRLHPGLQRGGVLHHVAQHGHDVRLHKHEGRHAARRGQREQHAVAAARQRHLRLPGAEQVAREAGAAGPQLGRCSGAAPCPPRGPAPAPTCALACSLVIRVSSCSTACRQEAGCGTVLLPCARSFMAEGPCGAQRSA